jgi:hypothetical protein
MERFKVEIGEGVLEPGILLLAKPFTGAALLERVHEALHRDRSGGAMPA